MPDFQCIDVEDAKTLLTQGARCFDIRDIDSFNNGHPLGATQLNNDNLIEQLSMTDKEQPILVFCYHGISSQNAAQYISGQGFAQVLSVNGGFERWQSSYPELIE